MRGFGPARPTAGAGGRQPAMHATRRVVLQREADVVEAMQQAFAPQRVDRER